MTVACGNETSPVTKHTSVWANGISASLVLCDCADNVCESKAIISSEHRTRGSCWLGDGRLTVYRHQMRLLVRFQAVPECRKRTFAIAAKIPNCDACSSAPFLCAALAYGVKLKWSCHELVNSKPRPRQGD